jgi:hypothetical protein
MGSSSLNKPDIVKVISCPPVLEVKVEEVTMP